MHNSGIDMVVVSIFVGNLDVVHLCDPADRLLDTPHGISTCPIRLQVVLLHKLGHRCMDLHVSKLCVAL